LSGVHNQYRSWRAILLGGVLWALITGTALGASFTVNSTADPGDGVCDATECTLKEAIDAANANPGLDVIEFAIPTTDPGFNGHWWTIALESALPEIREAVTIDGFTQTTNVGDTNPCVVGTGGTVGVDGLPLPPYNCPEVAIKANDHGTTGVLVVAAGTTGPVVIRGLAIYDAASLDPAINVEENATDVTVEGNFLGLLPDGTAPAGDERNRFDGVAFDEGSSGAIRNNYIGHNGRYGINLGNGAVQFGELVDVLVEGNEVFQSGWNTQLGDNISIYADGATVRGNLIRDPQPGTGTNPRIYGAGIELRYGAEGNLIENNVILRSLTKGIIADTSAHANTIRRNIIRDTQNGPGIVISEYDSTTGEGPEVRNRISQNHISANAGLGIDLCDGCGSSDNQNGVTPNDGAFTTDPNEGLDFPVLTAAELIGTTLHVEGYVGTGPGDPDFGGITIEVFLADGDPSGHGEGLRFLGSCSTNATDGDFLCDLTGAVGLSAGDPLTATAIDARGNTSEFGPNFPLQKEATSTYTVPALSHRGMLSLLALLAGISVLWMVRRRRVVY